MLDAFIIHEIRRREHEKAQRERQRPSIQLPLHSDDDRADDERQGESDEKPGGVVQIDL
ncbi:MAG: hypothetical protein JNG84_15130 [Archangium sp.]|nr:hypothetical protein [Archangium sp.]